MKRSLEKRLGRVSKSLAWEKAEKESLEEEENDRLRKRFPRGFSWHEEEMERGTNIQNGIGGDVNHGEVLMKKNKLLGGRT